MGVLRGELDAATIGSADNKRDLDLAAGEVTDFGCVLDNLIRCEEREIPGHHLDYRLQAHHRHTDSRPSEAKLRDGCIYHPVGAVYVYKAVCYEVRTAVDADILSHEEYVLVALHLLLHGGPEGLAVGHLGHKTYSSPIYSSSPA
jgi:hypothetical protein